MCGIYGEIRFDEGATVDLVAIQVATRAMAHRGPDDEGFYNAGHVGLGFRRLSIIDLAGGHQPMSDPGGHVWVVFNGEIYNFAELRRELVALGHVFRTNSDTEVIVHGYVAWGEECLDKLRGMFGLAIWDVRHRKLVVARDAMGIKPVYYREDALGVRFASEMRPLLLGRGGKPDLDPVSLHLFLRHRYTPSPRTLFSGIKKLAPGTMFVVEKGRARESRWYRFAPTAMPSRRGLPEAADELLERYRLAVRRHLVSDVPVGLFLSGGIDSALLLALMSEQGSGWNTYTVGFGASEKEDELELARATAEAFGARHTGLQISREEFERALPEVVDRLEEPVATPSTVSMFLLCARARQDVKVALVGQGPDELFGGYTRHLGVAYGAAWRGAPNWFRAAGTALIGRLPRSAALKRGVDALSHRERMSRYRQVLSLAPAESVSALFRQECRPEPTPDVLSACWHDLLPGIRNADELSGFQWLEVQSTLPDELLLYTDKMSMAHGLEMRVPYLDRDVVEFAFSLDAALKVHGGRRKVVHRRVCTTFLPAQIVRRKKRGLTSHVVDDWFMSSLGGQVAQRLRDSGSRLYSILDPAAVANLLEQHQARTMDHHKILFSLVVLDEWMRAQGIPR